MKVYNSIPLHQVAGVRRRVKPKDDDSPFNSEDDTSVEASKSTVLSPIAQANHLLSLQEAETKEETAKEKSKKRAKQMLSYLEDVRLSLLKDGKISKDKLERIQKLIQAEREKTFDLNLDKVLNDIELRTAVEIAKIEKIENK